MAKRKKTSEVAEYLSQAVQKKRAREIMDKINPPPSQKKTAKVIPLPTRQRKVVRATKVDYHFATCPECGNKIKLEPAPILQSSRGVHFPVLVGAICRKCDSEVRFDTHKSKLIPPPGHD